jgi:hypothetical protein
MGTSVIKILIKHDKRSDKVRAYSKYMVYQRRTEGAGGGWGVQTPIPRNSEVLLKLSRIPSSVEYTPVTT